MSWEGGSQRIALAVDSYIYLANIRPEVCLHKGGNPIHPPCAQPHAAHTLAIMGMHPLVSVGASGPRLDLERQPRPRAHCRG